MTTKQEKDTKDRHKPGNRLINHSISDSNMGVTPMYLARKNLSKKTYFPLYRKHLADAIR